MDKKKAVLVVVLALLLAFVVAMLMKPKQIETNPALNQNNEQMTDPVFDTAEDDVAPKNEIVKENTEDTLVEKSAVKTVKEVTLDVQEKTPEIKMLQVKEDTTKVEEASVSFEDPGIINEDGVIVVTRDFKIKSPRKYSFKDFGVLAEPPVR